MRDIKPTPTVKDKDDSISLRAIVTPLFRRKRLLIISFLSIFAILAGLSLLAGGSYESHISILVSRERMDPLVTTQSTNQMLGATPPLTDEEVNSEAELLQSSDLLRKVVLANGLQNQKGFSIFDVLRPRQTEEDRIARAVRGLARKLKVETPTKTNLIEVTYSSSNPAISYGVLRSLGDLYLEKHATVHRPAGSSDFFAQQAQSYKDALDRSEARLHDFGEKENAADPDEQRTDLALQLANDIGQLHTTEQAIAGDEKRISSDLAQMAVTPQRSATKEETNASNILLQELGSSLLAAQTKRTQLLLKYDPNYPLVKEANQEVAQIQAAIADAQKAHYVNQETDRDPTFELLREDLSKTRGDLAAHRASLLANKDSISDMQAEMVKLGNQSLQLADLQREAKANEQNYLLYLSKREQERTSDALDRTRIENVAIAVPPAMAVLPVHGPLYAVALAFGIALILSLCITYAADYLDPSFHSTNQVVDTLGIPVVVAINRRSA
jgi:uncharacterized protein involved in exopolysaccharide biosynthesis